MLINVHKFQLVSLPDIEFISIDKIIDADTDINKVVDQNEEPFNTVLSEEESDFNKVIDQSEEPFNTVLSEEESDLNNIDYMQNIEDNNDNKFDHPNHKILKRFRDKEDDNVFGEEPKSKKSNTSFKIIFCFTIFSIKRESINVKFINVCDYNKILVISSSYDFSKKKS